MFLLAILLGVKAAGGGDTMRPRMDIYFTEDAWDTAASCTVSSHQTLNSSDCLCIQTKSNFRERNTILPSRPNVVTTKTPNVPTPAMTA